MLTDRWRCGLNFNRLDSTAQPTVYSPLGRKQRKAGGETTEDKQGTRIYAAKLHYGMTVALHPNPALSSNGHFEKGKQTERTQMPRACSEE